MREDHEIGPFIRKLRKERSMSMSELAKHTGLSQGFLSKVENSKSAPSVSTLIKISKALKARLSYILGEAEDETDITIVKKGERREMARTGAESGYRYEALAPHFLNRKMDPYILTHEAGRDVTPILQHEGQEMLYVLQGSTKFFYGTKEMVLEEGDCVYYDSGKPHYGKPIGDTDLKCVVVVFNHED